jgi:asparagine synthetase B (glutamine-hydrolysing)
MPSDDEAKEELVAIYRRAMKRHLLSDVPVGLLLSGGLDSGLLLALMNERGREWPTFTIGYGSGFKDDELKDAAETAALFGAKHTSIQIDKETFAESLPRIVSCLEEPIAASSIVPMYFVSQQPARRKVALNGQGPDELFMDIAHPGVRYGGCGRGCPHGFVNRWPPEFRLFRVTRPKRATCCCIPRPAAPVTARSLDRTGNEIEICSGRRVAETQATASRSVGQT